MNIRNEADLIKKKKAQDIEIHGICPRRHNVSIRFESSGLSGPRGCFPE
jgi:hypothetical protein